jgi:hypothetical protein
LFTSKKQVLLDQSAQARGEAGKFWIHAVFDCGWLSATAGEDINAVSRGHKPGLCVFCVGPPEPS